VLKNFLAYANAKGIKIFYVTNRTHDLEEYTRNNIKALGLPLR
jgi:acid phosphatase